MRVACLAASSAGWLGGKRGYRVSTNTSGARHAGNDAARRGQEEAETSRVCARRLRCLEAWKGATGPSVAQGGQDDEDDDADDDDLDSDELAAMLEPAVEVTDGSDARTGNGRQSSCQ